MPAGRSVAQSLTRIDEALAPRIEGRPVVLESNLPADSTTCTCSWFRRKMEFSGVLTMLTLSQVVIIQPIDGGNKSHPYGHALVAGIERYPSKITRRMSKARQEKRSKIKPFIKVINYNHLMPTRYTLELEGLKGAVTTDTFKEVSQREEAKKNVKKVLEERYASGKNRWFFTPLRMCFQCPTLASNVGHVTDEKLTAAFQGFERVHCFFWEVGVYQERDVNSITWAFKPKWRFWSSNKMS